MKLSSISELIHSLLSSRKLSRMTTRMEEHVVNMVDICVSGPCAQNAPEKVETLFKTLMQKQKGLPAQQDYLAVPVC